MQLMCVLPFVNCIGFAPYDGTLHYFDLNLIPRTFALAVYNRLEDISAQQYCLLDAVMNAGSI